MQNIRNKAYFSGSKNRGFTLIELMITVAILAIITAIAYPSYTENVRRGKRAEVRSALLEDAQYMERFFTENSSYLISANNAQPALPNTVIPRGATGAAITYNIRFAANPARTATTYVLEAIPANSMAADPCNGFTLNHVGQRGSTTPPTEGKTTADCWSK